MEAYRAILEFTTFQLPTAYVNGSFRGKSNIRTGQSEGSEHWKGNCQVGHMQKCEDMTQNPPLIPNTCLTVSEMPMKLTKVLHNLSLSNFKYIKAGSRSAFCNIRFICSRCTEFKAIIYESVDFERSCSLHIASCEPS